MEEKLNIEIYKELYRDGYKLDQIKPLKNQTYKIFKASGVDIRVVHRSSVYKNPTGFKKIKHFTLDNEYFYMIPVTTIKGTIVGFILRGVLRSDYSTISREFEDSEHKVPLMFGFDKSFEKFQEKEVCYPIVVCEGSKDCLFLKKLYPYTVAINTSSMGLNAHVLINLSNKFILAYDNDEAGQEGIKRDKKILRSLGAQVVDLELDKTKNENGKFLFKDCSDYLGHPKKMRALQEEFNYKFKRVMSF